MRVAVIVLNFNRKEDTLLAIASLKKQTYQNLEIVLIDNGSKDISGFKELGITFIENGKNLGFAEGNNVGIRRAKADAYFLLNNDTEIEPDCIERLVDFSTKHPKAIIGARLLLFADRERIDHLGGVWNEKTANFDLIANGEIFDENKHMKPIECDFVCGAAFFIPKEIIERIGLLESSFFLIWEESDFCMRAKGAGFSSIYCPSAIVYHKVSSSFSGGKPHIKYYWWRNRLLFIQRNLVWRKYYKLISQEIAHLLKLYIIKSCEISFRTILRMKITPKKRETLNYYRASLKGIFHYFLGRFGNLYCEK